MATDTALAPLLHVATLDELTRKGVIVVHGADRPIAVWHHEGKVFAVDNRCPHLGFPLHRGSVKDGILTCHWHHARFDLCSGCTFDLFADDVPAYQTEVRDGEVYVHPHPRQDDRRDYYVRRLIDGMQQNISLIQAKSLIALLRNGADHRAILRHVALFGVEHRDDWASGLTTLTAMANLVPHLGEETAYLALYQGTRRTAADCAGQAPRRRRHALDTGDLPFDTLMRWLRYWTLVRQRDGAERTLLTAVSNGMGHEELAALLFTAATERPFAAGGHLLDFINKAFELLDLIGFEHADQVWPALVSQLVTSRGGEEDNSFRHPVDLIPPMQKAGEQLPALLQQGRNKTWANERQLAQAMLGDEPLAIIEAISQAIRDGARPWQLTKALAYAAAMRVARFGASNEFGDWITALHTFTYCNALHHAVNRTQRPEVLRGIYHGAISVYLDRFLNVPPAKLPGERGSLDDLSKDGDALLAQFLDLLNQRQEIDLAARLVARYLRLKHPLAPLFDTLTRAVVREDADFHSFQMVEAAIRQYHEWEGEPEGEHILVAAARYVAAHSPTQRAQLQTATVAMRLHRGDKIYEE